MISPALAEQLYEARMKELGGYDVIRHYAVVQYVAGKLMASEADVAKALLRKWQGRE